MSAEFKLAATGAGAVKAIEDLNKVLDASQATADGVTKATKRMVDQAQRIKESNDPQAKYNRQMQELGQLVKVAGLSIEDAQAKAVKYGVQLERASQAGEKAFGGEALRNIGSVAMAVTGITGALDLAVDAMRNFREEQKKAADDAMRARQGVGQLSQLAASDKDPAAAFKGLVAEADSYLAMGAATDRNEAATLTFDLAAAGLEKNDRAFAAKMRSTGTLTNVGGLAQAYDALKTAMGEQEVGTFEQFSSKALAAGATAPGTVEQLPVALARAGANAKALGISDEFLLSAGAVLAKEAGSPAEGGTKLNALLAGIRKSGVDVSGLSGAEMIERLGQENTGFGGIFKDSNEAIGAFKTLQENLASTKGLEGDIFSAQNKGLALEAIGLPNLDDSQRAANLRAEAEGGLAVVNNENLSRAENLRQAAMADWSARMRREAPGWRTEASIALERFGTGVPILGDPNRHLGFAATAEPGSPGAIENQELLQEIRDHLKSIDNGTRAKVTTQQE